MGGHESTLRVEDVHLDHAVHMEKCTWRASTEGREYSTQQLPAHVQTYAQQWKDHAGENKDAVFVKEELLLEFSSAKTKAWIVLMRMEVLANISLGKQVTSSMGTLNQLGAVYKLNPPDILEKMGLKSPSYTIETYFVKSYPQKPIFLCLLDHDLHVIGFCKLHPPADWQSIDEHIKKQWMKSVVEREHRIGLLTNKDSLPCDHPFALMKVHIDQVMNIQRQKPSFIEASDGIKLAFRAYFPREPFHTIVIEALGNSFVNDLMADEVIHCYPIAYVLFELRGHGYSGGPRGYTPSLQQSCKDIQRIVRYFRLNFPNKSIFLAGGSRVAGMVLNYSSWSDREEPDGYVFLSPNFGMTARSVWDDAKMARFRQQLGAKVHRKNLFFTFLTDGIWMGAQPGLEFPVDDQVSKAVNTFVSRFSAALMFAMTASNPKKQLQNICAPFGLWVARNDSLLSADKLVQLAHRAIEHSHRTTAELCQVDLVEECPTHLEYFTWATKYFAPWTLNVAEICRQSSQSTEATSEVSTPSKHRLSSRTNSLSSEASHELRRNVMETDICTTHLTHPVLTDISTIVRRRSELHLPQAAVRYFESMDGFELAYAEYLPESGSRPQVNVAMVRSGFEPPTAALLARHYDIAVYVLSMRGFGHSSGNVENMKTKVSVLSDLRSFLRILRYNHPEIPIFLCAHGIHAGLLFNYAEWKDREPINSYLFLSPVLFSVEPTSSEESHAYVYLETLKRYIHFQKGRFKWPMTSGNGRSDSITVLGFSTTDMGGSVLQQDELHLPLEVARAYRVDNPAKAIASLDVPFGVWIGALDELVRGQELLKMIEATTTSTFHELSLLENCNHLNILFEAVTSVGEFTMKRVKQLSLSQSQFRIHQPHMDDFEEFEPIGRGAYGHVFLARHKPTDRYLAIKVQKKKELVESGEVEAVIQERNVLRDLDCPFVVSYIGSFKDACNLYIIMEFVVGGELFTQLTRTGRFENDRARFYAAELVLFFEYMHGHGYVYRDLKPENVLLDSMGHIKMVDFGFAKRILGRTRSFCGTPEYIAPEMILRQDYDYSVDYWSFGIVLYEMLVGVVPHSGRTATEVYRKILYNKIDISTTLDPDARDLLKRLLIQKPNDRLGSYSDTKNSKRLQGIDEIKAHKWFNSIDWDRMRARDYEPPFVPPSSFEGDTSNFLSFEASISCDGGLITLEEESLFNDF